MKALPPQQTTIRGLRVAACKGRPSQLSGLRAAATLAPLVEGSATVFRSFGRRRAHSPDPRLGRIAETGRLADGNTKSQVYFSWSPSVPSKPGSLEACSPLSHKAWLGRFRLSSRRFMLLLGLIFPLLLLIRARDQTSAAAREMARQEQGVLRAESDFASRRVFQVSGFSNGVFSVPTATRLQEI